MKGKVYLESLGCPKNLVDSEVIAGYLVSSGFTFTTRREEAEIIIVNTCAFIKDATEEALSTIRSLIPLKQEGRCRTFVVAGCLPERYGRKFFTDSPDLKEVDLLIGSAELPNIAQLLLKRKAADKKIFSSSARQPAFLPDHSTPRILATPSHTAYLKIAEGCSHRCSFCTIPAIKGPYRSRQPQSVVADAARWAARGVREINLIAQDTTFYGSDLSPKSDLASLLRQLSRIEELTWIRLLYCHPDHFSKDLMTVISEEEKICSYIDLPLQHISDTILKKMGREKKGAGIRKLIKALRKNIPHLWLRTTVMVGFPGETDEDFNLLMDFLCEVAFEHLGAFRYSDEEETGAYLLGKKVPAAIIEERYHRVMSAQSLISLAKNRALIGSRQKVLIEGTDRNSGRLTGRTFFQAPEIDGIVYLDRGSAAPGELLEVTITAASEYDLSAEPARGG